MAYLDVLLQVKDEVHVHTGIPLGKITESTVIGEKIGEVAGAFGVQEFSVDMTVELLAQVVSEKRDFPPVVSSEFHRM